MGDRKTRISQCGIQTPNGVCTAFFPNEAERSRHVDKVHAGRHGSGGGSNSTGKRGVSAIEPCSDHGVGGAASLALPEDVVFGRISGFLGLDGTRLRQRHGDWPARGIRPRPCALSFILPAAVAATTGYCQVCEKKKGPPDSSAADAKRPGYVRLGCHVHTVTNLSVCGECVSAQHLRLLVLSRWAALRCGATSGSLKKLNAVHVARSSVQRFGALPLLPCDRKELYSALSVLCSVRLGGRSAFCLFSQGECEETHPALVCEDPRVHNYCVIDGGEEQQHEVQLHLLSKDQSTTIGGPPLDAVLLICSFEYTPRSNADQQRRAKQMANEERDRSAPRGTKRSCGRCGEVWYTQRAVTHNARTCDATYSKVAPFAALPP